LRQHGFLERTMRSEQGDQARRFVDDAALEADRGVAGIDAATDSVWGEKSIEFREKQMTGQLFAIERHGFAVREAELHGQGAGWPLHTRRTPAACAFAGRFPAINLAS